MTVIARQGSRQLASLSLKERQQILLNIAESIWSSRNAILAENAKDLEIAKKNKISLQLLSRLKLDENKLETVVKGMKSIAMTTTDPIGNFPRIFHFRL